MVYTNDRLFVSLRKWCALLPIISVIHLVYAAFSRDVPLLYDDIVNSATLIVSSWIFLVRHRLSNRRLINSIGVLMIIYLVDNTLFHREHHIALIGGLAIAIVGLRFYPAWKMLVLFGIHLVVAIAMWGFNINSGSHNFATVDLIEVILCVALMHLATLNHQKSSTDLSVIRQQNIQNEELRRYFERLFTDSPDGILLVSHRQSEMGPPAPPIIEKCNQAAADELGLEMSEVIGRTVYEISPIRQGSGITAFKRYLDIQQALSTRDDAIKERRFEWPHLHSNGSIVWHEVMIKYFGNDNGRDIFLTLWRNIDKRVELEHQTRTLIDDLERRKSAQEYMYGVVSHELRTPVAMSAMLLNEPDIDIARVKSLNQHTIAILDDLKDVFGKTNTGTDKRKFTEVDIVQLMADVVRSLRVTEHNEHLAFHILKKPNTQCVLITDQQALMQLARNIVVNCVRHSQANNLWINVSGTTRDQAHAHITFEDDGVGISPEMRNNLFNLKVPRQNHDAGLGLGLYISRELAQERLGGDITFCERAGGGSSFSVRIMPAQMIELKNQAEEPFDHYVLDGKSILLVEDSPTFLELTKRLLEQYGAHVSVAENGVIGLQKALEANHDIVITDIVMPELDGYELTKALRSYGYQGKIIALTAVGIGSEYEKILECGADGSITKPIKISALIELI